MIPYAKRVVVGWWDSVGATASAGEGMLGLAEGSFTRNGELA